MKKEIRFLTAMVLLLFLFSLVPVLPVSAATSASCPAPDGKSISVMSFNVLNNNNKDSNGNFTYPVPSKREDAIAAMIKSYQPDIIGIQEAGQGGDSGKLDWCSALNTDLKSIYAYRSLKDDTGLALDVYRGLIIFYNKSRFTLVSSGGQGYSDPANSKRAFHWVKLKDKNTNTEFYVFNTHWQYDGNQTLAQNQATRATQCAELAKKVNSLAKNHHFFITGDFNSSYVLASSSTKCDAVNVAKLMQNANYADGLVTAPEKFSIDGNGTRTSLQTNDKSLQTCFDHVVYHDDFYTPVKMEKILSRTYSTKLSDHDAILVHFKYKMPSFTVSANEGTLDPFYSNGAYYIDNFDRRTTDLPITVKLSGGGIYTDAAGTASAGTALTMKSGNAQTYRPANTLYIKWGGMVQTLYLRSCNINTYATGVFVDQSMTDKAPGSTTLYCDKWYGRLVTVGVNGFATIQEAINAAGNGFDILVAPGTYSENLSINGKSLKLYGQNRTNLKALVIKNGKLEVNTSGRTYETYLTGNITYNVGNQQAASLMVNGFHFTGSTPTAQIYLTGGTANQTLDLRISNNLFNCYTNGAPNNGSAVHGISAVQKTGSIEDNYFHLTQIPTYTDSNGKTVNYTNRGITLRNLKNITVSANYFNGYTGSKMRPFWLSSEVSSGSTTPGYGNVTIIGNRFENSYPGALHINNIRAGTNANILIAGNSYGGEKMNVDFSQTANQTSQNLPTDKSKINFRVQTDDYTHLNITPASPGVTAKKFTYYVTFRSEDGMYIYDTSPVSGTTVAYAGPTPTKASNAANHYSFQNWVTEKGGSTAANLSSIKANANVFATFTATAHTVAERGGKAATCTEAGATPEKYCTVCGHIITGSTSIPATGHSYTYSKINGETHAVGCQTCTLYETAPHSYENGVCICGEPEIKEPIVDETVTIGHTLNLASDISVNYAVRTELLKDYVNHYLVCELPVYEGNVQTGTRTVTLTPVLNGNYYYYTLTGITAVQMGDRITAQLHMEKDGQAYLSSPDLYSVGQYAYSQLHNASAPDRLKKLCADLLRYGKEAQTYKNYRTDTLVDREMTEAHRAYLSDLEAVSFGSTNQTLADLENPAILWVGKSLALDSKVAVKYVFEFGSYTGSVEELSLKVSYVNHSGEKAEAVISHAEVYNSSTGRYAFTFDALLAAELRCVVDAAIYAGETRVSQTLRYSPDTYGNNKTGQLLTLCKALFAYSDTAKAYFS
ncbi:MAG: endonuclease/exonuclease/phosphatase family protein [Oscillospiraceae bacterium]|nr:endonuclease/exonuclease/phosphatase family protein [Oscillospiraceae bacterium]